MLAPHSTLTLPTTCPPSIMSGPSKPTRVIASGVTQSRQHGNTFPPPQIPSLALHQTIQNFLANRTAVGRTLLSMRGGRYSDSSSASFLFLLRHISHLIILNFHPLFLCVCVCVYVLFVWVCFFFLFIIYSLCQLPFTHPFASLPFVGTEYCGGLCLACRGRLGNNSIEYYPAVF